MSKAKFDFIRYANCWEDPNNLLEALDIEGKTGLSVLSAGDNTIAMLIKNPQRIVAFDINPTQIYLFNLKRVGFLYLDYDKLLNLLGIYDTRKSYEIFLSLEKYLDKDSFEFFKFKPQFFKKGIINIGKFEHYFQIFNKYIVPVFSSKEKMERLASFMNLEEQKEYYKKEIDNKRLNFIFNIFFGSRVMGKLGRDKEFYNYIENKKYIGKNIKKILDYGITHIINFNNPYINYVLTNHINDKCLPLYLRKENFEVIKNRINRIEVIHSPFADIKGKYDFFNLSDIFEYMSKDEFENNINILSNTSKDNSYIAYYNMQNKRYINHKNFIFLEEISKKLTLQTKSYFYRDFLVYKFIKNNKS